MRPVCLLIAATSLLVAPSLSRASGFVAPAAHTAAPTAIFSNLPLSFERNDGQTDRRVQFMAHGPHSTVYLTNSGAVLALGNKSAKTASESVLEMDMIGATAVEPVLGVDALPGKVNYFIGSDPKKWHTNIPTFKKVAYTDVYKGIDLVYYGAKGHLEYDFDVHPGADASKIKLAFSGVASSHLASNGDLVLQLAHSCVTWRKPVVYQLSHGVRRPVAGGYVAAGNTVSFKVAQHDASLPLVIDPVLVYAGALGGTTVDVGRSIAVDSLGDAYLTGYTESSDFPTTNGLYTSLNGTEDAVVVKLNPTATSALYSTYLGGSGNDSANSIAIDSNGEAVVCGDTTSRDFPLVSPIQSVYGGGASRTRVSAFVAKLTASGNAIVYSTYLGKSYANAYSVALDPSNNAYVTGLAGSDFPVTTSLGTAPSGGPFVVKLNAAGSAIDYSSIFNAGTPSSVAVDNLGDAFVAGEVGTTGLTPVNAAQGSFGGGNVDAYLAKINPAGTAFGYLTFYGGSGDDVAQAVAVDSSGNAIIGGYTSSTDLPTYNALQPSLKGTQNAFVAKFDPTGAYVFATYLGGSGTEGYGGVTGSPMGVAVDSIGAIYVTGLTDSSDFPVVSPIPNSPATGSAFVSKVTPRGDALVYSTFIANARDYGVGIAVDAAGSAYVLASGESDGFPTINTPTSSAGLYPLLFAKLSQGPPILTNLTPYTCEANNGPQTLTVQGFPFAANATIVLNTIPVKTVHNGDGTLSTTIPASSLIEPGTFAVSVVNPGAAGGTSGALDFSPLSFTPVIGGSLSWSSVPSTATTFQLYAKGVGYTPPYQSTVYPGTGYVPGFSQIVFNGTAIPAGFTSTGLWTAAIPLSLYPTPGTSVPVMLQTTGGQGGDSAPLTFTGNPIPSIAAITPAQVSAGASEFTMNITGANFIPGAVVNIGGNYIPTSLNADGSLSIDINNPAKVTVGNYPLTVVSPSPGGGSSAPVTFKVVSVVGTQLIFPFVYSVQPSIGAPATRSVYIVLTGINPSTPPTGSIGVKVNGGTLVNYPILLHNGAYGVLLSSTPTAYPNTATTISYSYAGDANYNAFATKTVALNAIHNIVEITSSVKIAPAGFVVVAGTTTISQNVTITNTMNVPLTGNVQFVIDSLSSGASLPNAPTITFPGLTGGDPYIQISNLAAGASQTINIPFTDPTKARISYTPNVIEVSD